MSRGDFFSPETVFQAVPELLRYIPEERENIMRVGLSLSGNVKFQTKGAGGLVQVVSKTSVPETVMHRFTQFAIGPDSSGVLYAVLDSPAVIPATQSPGDVHVYRASAVFPVSLFKTCFLFAMSSVFEGMSQVVVHSDGVIEYQYSSKKKKRQGQPWSMVSKQIGIALWDYIGQSALDGKTKEEVIAIVARDKKERLAQWETFFQTVLDELPMDEVREIGNILWKRDEFSLGVNIEPPKTALFPLLPVHLFVDAMPSKEDMKKEAWANIRTAVAATNIRKKMDANSLLRKRFEKKMQAYFQSMLPSVASIHWLSRTIETPGQLYARGKDYEIRLEGGVVLEGISVPTKDVEFPVLEKAAGQIGRMTYELPTDTGDSIETAIQDYTVFPDQFNVKKISLETPPNPSSPCGAWSATMLKGDADVGYRYRAINKCCDPLMNGMKPFPITNLEDMQNIKAEVCDGEWVCLFETPVATYRVTRDGFTVTERPGSGFVVKLVELARYKSAVQFVRQELQNAHIGVQYKSGIGLVLGDTVTTVSQDGIMMQYIWHLPSFKDGLTVWKKALHQEIKKAQQMLAEEAEKKEEKKRDSLGPFADSFLAKDIAKFVDVNDKYITANATNSYLRGLSMQFGGSIRDTGAEGLYKLMSSDDVLNMIKAMVRHNLFYTVTLKGTYGRFDILKSTTSTATLIRLKPVKQDIAQLIKTAKVALRKGDPVEYNDYEAEAVFLYLKSQPELSSKDCIILLELARAKGFLCRYHEEYVSFARANKDRMSDYLEMQKAVEEDKVVKKVLQEILKKPVAAKKKTGQENEFPGLPND